MSGSWVAVTGATGFIGRVLLQSLIKEGWKVKALTRRPRADDEFTQWIEGDLDNHHALRSLVTGVSAVVHCAGQVRGSSLKDFVHTNVDGTDNLVRASIEQSSPPRFLLISSLAARQPELSWYAASKRMAEQLISDHSQRMPYAVFRPTAVYGPGDKEMSPLFRATRIGLLPMVGQSRMRFGLLHVNDLVAAIICWLSTKNPVQGVYELDDLWSARLLRYSPMLTPGKVRELQHPNWVCDITPLTHALPGWRPSVQLRDALPQAV